MLETNMNDYTVFGNGYRNGLANGLPNGYLNGTIYMV